MISELLIKYETLDGEQVMEILKTGKAPDGLSKNGNGHTGEAKMNPAEVIPDVPAAPETPPAE